MGRNGNNMVDIDAAVTALAEREHTQRPVTSRTVKNGHAMAGTMPAGDRIHAHLEEHGPCSQRALREELVLHKSTVVYACHALEAQGRLVKVGAAKYRHGSPSPIWAVPGDAREPREVDVLPVGAAKPVGTRSRKPFEEGLPSKSLESVRVVVRFASGRAFPRPPFASSVPRAGSPPGASRSVEWTVAFSSLRSLLGFVQGQGCDAVLMPVSRTGGEFPILEFADGDPK